MSVSLQTNCGHCGATHVHAPHVSHVEKRENRGLIGRQEEWVVHDGLYKCGYCSRGIYVALEKPVSPYQSNSVSELSGPPTENGWRVKNVAPARRTEAAPLHTPDNIGSFYTQGLRALNRRDYDAAGMSLRKSIDVATKHLIRSASITEGAIKKNLAQRIDVLGENYLLTPQLVEWGHEIRLDGNEAAHDDVPYSKDDAEVLADFVEVFLRYAFQIPGMLAEKRKEARE